jgi:peptidoglycan/xylan/chitin deacetylase (PgdA/CDA1 family)
MVRSSWISGWLLAACALALPDARAAERVVAVTFDDLPAPPAAVVANDVASLRQLTRKLLDAVRKYGVPAVGFVNEGKLFVEGAGPADVEGRTGLLRMWVDAGLELGNHTYSHHDLNRTPLEEFEADVVRSCRRRAGSCGTSAIPSSTSVRSCRNGAPSKPSLRAAAMSSLP